MASPEDKKSLEDERDSLSKDLSIKVVVREKTVAFPKSKVGAWRRVVCKGEYQH